MWNLLVDKNQNQKLPKWDLDLIYSDLESDRFKNAILKLKTLSNNLSNNYEDKIAKLNGADLAMAIKDYEEISELQYSISSFLEMLNISDIRNNKKTIIVEQELSEINGLTSFFEFEINELQEQDLIKRMSNPDLARYAPWLGKIRGGKDNIMSEELEDYNSDIYYAAIKPLLNFYYENQEEIAQEFKLAEDEDGSISRQKSAEILKKFGKQNAFIYKSLIKNAQVEAKARGYEEDYQAENQANHIKDEIVELFFKSVQNNYQNISHEYYDLIAKLHGKAILNSQDLITKIPKFKDNKYIEFDIKDAENIILDSLENLSPELQKMAKGFFDDDYIDAENRDNKVNCFMAIFTGKEFHPFISINYNKLYSDVIGLAHELGHGVHQILAPRKQSFFLAEMTTVTSEMASIFAEGLAYNQMIDNVKDEDLKKELIFNKVDEIISNGIHQLAYYQFERRIYAEIKDKDLDFEEISDIWIEVLQEAYGSSVELDDYDRYFWTQNAAFFETPFYSYSYSFAQIMVIVLNEQYQSLTGDELQEFKDKYVEFLETGISKDIVEIMADFGFDIETQEFWDNSLNLFADHLDLIEDIDKIDFENNSKISNDFNKKLADNKDNKNKPKGNNANINEKPKL